MERRTFKNYLLSIVILFIFLSCSRSNDTIPEEVINNPTAAILSFPENNTECNEGVIINDNKSRVNFQWKASEFTDNYTVVLKNLTTNITLETESKTSTVEIIIDRSASYQWHVISKSEINNETTQSDIWKFYNAGKGKVNYAPFPADIVAPENGNTISQIDDKIILEWNTVDIDNDIKEYEVFFGSENTSKESLGIVNKNKFEVNVASGTKYFWMIKTIDEVGNSSTSDVFNFMVN
ncbi:hypothetical protein JQC67_15235 [Aurantibacter crassamenti]|uniref:hypothetical protein n=1 Tax=Aurantibacter crassamenti TaxID=1837375 RepID=UPI00193A9A32|nr:hypothetical protein [Aurantibacter crassamenti]MBM1107507.1 hypothetical protein [Aurantibacter crassamenti]